MSDKPKSLTLYTRVIDIKSMTRQYSESSYIQFYKKQKPQASLKVTLTPDWSTVKSNKSDVDVYLEGVVERSGMSKQQVNAWALEVLNSNSLF